MAVIEFLLEYSPILQLFATIALTGAIAILSLQQWKLNKKEIERPDWNVSDISLGGDKEECYGSITLENNGGIGSNVKVLWATTQSKDAVKGERPKIEKKHDSETTFLKRADPGDSFPVTIEIENLDNLDHIRLCVSSDENTDQPKIEVETLEKALNEDY